MTSKKNFQAKWKIATRIPISMFLNEPQYILVTHAFIVFCDLVGHYLTIDIVLVSV